MTAQDYRDIILLHVFHVLVNELKGLCLDVELVGSRVSEDSDEDEPKPIENDFEQV